MIALAFPQWLKLIFQPQNALKVEYQITRIKPDRRVTPHRCLPLKPASFSEHIQGKLKIYVWYAGKIIFLQPIFFTYSYLFSFFWDSAVALDPRTRPFRLVFLALSLLLCFLCVFCFLQPFPFFFFPLFPRPDFFIMGVHGDEFNPWSKIKKFINWCKKMSSLCFESCIKFRALK